MTLFIEKANQLPVETWNYLGVNSTGIREEIPGILRPYEGPHPLIPSLPGVEITSALPQIPDIDNMDTGMGPNTREFVDRNRNLGLCIKVQAGVRVEQPLVLEYRLNEKNPALVDSNLIIAGEGSEITVVMSYTSVGGFRGFHGGLTRIYAHKNSIIHLVQVQMLDEDHLHFNDVGGIALENATIELLQAELGSRKAFAGCRVCLDGAGSGMDIKSIYLGSRQRSTDLNYIAEHNGRDTRSNIFVRGALLDESQKLFRGTIDFKKGASGAVGRESEYCLMFSPKVRSRSVPLILCGEENVEGEHAASTGKIDENKLFYLMSRGLDEISAKKLIIEAEFAPVTSSIPVAELKTAISQLVKERLDKIEQ